MMHSDAVEVFWIAYHIPMNYKRWKNYNKFVIKDAGDFKDQRGSLFINERNSGENLGVITKNFPPN